MRVGYRYNGVYDDGYNDPIEVALYEITELGNIDIVWYIIESGKIREPKYLDYLNQINDYKIQFDEIDTDLLTEIIKSYIGKRNFCLWLCNTRQNVYDNYMTDEDNEADIDECEIPDDAIIMSDLEDEGQLYCWYDDTLY